MKLLRSDLYLAQRCLLRKKTLIGALLSMAACVALSVCGTAKWVDRQMRENLLLQARLVAQLIDPGQVRSLSGTEADLASPSYQFIKKQLTLARQPNSRCRFLYLLGSRQKPPAGSSSGQQQGRSLFFYVDSEPADSKDYSAPGDVYDEETEDEWRVFETGVATVLGPDSDHWGVWVWALVPLTDPATGKLIAVLGMDVDARTWNRTVAAYTALPAGLTILLLSALFGVLYPLLQRTDRRLAEQQAALRSTEGRLMAAVEQSGEIIMITDAQGVIQYVNPAFVSVTGFSREEATGKRPSILKSGQQDDAYYRDLWETISGGKVWKGRFVNRHKNGTFYTEEANISPVRDEAGRIVNFVAVKRDITEHLQMTDQLLQAQKMESIGRLAGGVAHDFNNMLTVILGNTELALKRENPAAPIFSGLLEIREAAEHSADLTRQLLAFARKQAVVPRVIDLSETVSGMLKMLRRLIGESLELAWQPGKGAIMIKMDPSQINQILANLAVNARLATCGTGRLTIVTRTKIVDRAFCSLHLEARPGEYAVLAVSDNGCGMDKNTAEHIFEPFFTTRKMGSGTGLGLATVYGIVKQNYGFIVVSSELGAGTTFDIYLPRCTTPIDTGPSHESAAPVKKGSETVLVVEDEPAILALSKTMLEELGYRVLAAASPDEAIRIAHVHTSELHLLLTDMVMPKMNGQELSVHIVSRHPRIKCLFMSGYSVDVIVHHGVADKNIPFIQKPFTIKALSDKLREVLDAL